MRIFVLEDNAERAKWFQNRFVNDTVVIAVDVEPAIEILSKDLKFDLFFLDHDLGGRVYVDANQEKTGMDVARFLLDKDIKVPIVIHSMNIYGAKNMKSVLPKALMIPFPFLSNAFEKIKI